MQWGLEISGNPQQFILRGGGEQPNEQEERHKGSNKIGIDNLPLAAMTATIFFGFFYDNGSLSFSHGQSRFRSFFLGLPHMFLQFRETWPLGGVQHFAAKLDRQRRRITVDARKQSYPDALKHFRGFPQFLFQHSRERAHEAIAKENPKKGANQGLRDQRT